MLLSDAIVEICFIAYWNGRQKLEDGRLKLGDGRRKTQVRRWKAEDGPFLTSSVQAAQGQLYRETEDFSSFDEGE